MEEIKKHKYKKNFTLVSNEYLQDKELSWKAKGLITYVMSLPDDWSLNISDLKNRSKDGKDAVYTGMKELREKGYCKMTRTKDGKYFNGISYEIADFKAFLQHRDFQDIEKQDIENPTILSTKKNTNDLSVLFKPETVFDDFIQKWNKEKKAHGLNGAIRILDKKSQKQIHVLIKSDYQLSDIINCLRNALNDDYHKKTGYKYVTPEYITRINIFNKYNGENQQGSNDEGDYQYNY